MPFELISVASVVSGFIRKIITATFGTKIEYSFFNHAFNIASRFKISINSRIYENFVSVCKRVRI
jgi:hypothetical protein